MHTPRLLKNHLLKAAEMPAPHMYPYSEHSVEEEVKCYHKVALALTILVMSSECN